MKLNRFIGLSALTLMLSLTSCSLPSLGSSKDSDITRSESEIGTKESDEELWNPITDEIIAKAEACDYSFDPTSVIINKAEEYDYESAEFKAVEAGASTREGRNLVYFFEGAYAEGYQSTYSTHYGHLYLYDDGIFTAKIGETAIKGYWYNKANGKDCLEIVSNYEHYEHVEFELTGGTSFYTHAAFVYLDLGHLQRSMVVSGYMYYPDVAIFISTEDQLPTQVGDTYNHDLFVVLRVLKNLKFSAVIKQDDVQWTDPVGLQNGSRINNPGDYVVTAKWNGFEASVKFSIK